MSHYLYSSAATPYKTLPFNVTLHKKEYGESRATPIISHYHEQLEIDLLLSGEMLITVDDNAYALKEGDAVICNPFHIHKGEWADESDTGSFLGFTVDLRKMLLFKGSPLERVCLDLLENRGRFDELISARCGWLKQRLEELLTVYSEKSEINDCRALSLLYDLMAELLKSHYHAEDDRRALHRNIEFLRRVSIFVNENYSRDIGTADIAAALYTDVSQFCRTFKKHFGDTFSNHLCRYRCIRATEMYLYDGMTIADIAASVGFSDYCYFSKSFKKHIGVAPSVYFAKRRAR